MIDLNKIKEEVLKNYDLGADVIDATEFGNGHINDTVLLTLENEEKFVLQRINTNIFTKPVELMENIVNVTDFLRKKIIDQGGDPNRETLTVIKTKDGLPYYVDDKGNYWRIYNFITNAFSYDKVDKPEDFYESAIAFGNFQKMLADFPAETLHETIEGFHDTEKRFENFKKSVELNKSDRADKVKEEIKFVLDRQDVATYFANLQRQGKIPLRVTHNDTKLNNVMIDKDTKKVICVVDLDTVMPGLAMHDFGDSIRFGASSAAEDEKDLDKVYLDLDLFEIFTKGFIESLDGALTEQEIDLLPMGAKVMTYECGLRFLADYIDGDVYFKIHREGHNLDRARTQFKLVKEMEDKWDKMVEIVNKYK